jgi:TniQ
MNSESNLIYASWNLNGPSIPQRSQLYHLEPIGIGTGSIECLTSYASRLAAAHCLSPAVLLARTLVPIIGKQYWLRGHAGSTARSSILGYSSSQPAKLINGKGTIAKDWVTALQALTLRDDLKFLTMLPWTEAFTQKNLLRSSKAWCPSCYEDRRSGNQVVYEPLLWTFRDVEVCVKHNRRLNFQCQYCGQSLPWLSRSSQAGYCSNCDKWLGIPLEATSTETEISLSELDWQVWVTANLEEMISRAKDLPAPPKERIAQSLTLCIDQACDGIMNRFARLIDKRKSTVWGWQHAENQIPINDLLYMCKRLNISLVDFLYAASFVITNIELMSPSVLGSGVKAKRRPPRQLDNEVTERALSATLKEEAPLSMRAIAERLDLNKRVLYRHFPELCKAISGRYRHHRQAQCNNRRDQYEEELKQTKAELRASGVYPSRRRVARVIRLRTLNELQIAA